MGHTTRCGYHRVNNIQLHLSNLQNKSWRDIVSIKTYHLNIMAVSDSWLLYGIDDFEQYSLIDSLSAHVYPKES
jgi:hypothetical protein